jgi:hypothetical protein
MKARRRVRPKARPEEPEPDPRQLELGASALTVLPHELRPGDVYRDSGGVERTVRTLPRTYLNGHRVSAKVSPAGAPAAAIEIDWPAHQRLEVRRAGE